MQPIRRAALTSLVNMAADETVATQLAQNIAAVTCVTDALLVSVFSDCYNICSLFRSLCIAALQKRVLRWKLQLASFSDVLNAVIILSDSVSSQIVESVYYCNHQCQRQHWTSHKASCVFAATLPKSDGEEESVSRLCATLLNNVTLHPSASKQFLAHQVSCLYHLPLMVKGC